LPVLIMTALGGVDDRIMALEGGADDFVSKPVTPSEMRARIRSLLRKKALLDTMARNYRRALDLSAIDSLTGLFNHGYFYEYLGREIERASRYGHPVSLMMLDIDRFKDYNDTSGHPAGDRALRDISRIIQASIRKTDLAARYGGEEFAVVLPETSLDGTRPLAERIRKAVEEYDFPGEELLPHGRMTISIGIAVYPEQATNVTDLVSAADQALYQVKRTGGNQVAEYEAPGPRQHR
jgi:diguanylate cyclase (GGDEF)-like protein